MFYNFFKGNFTLIVQLKIIKFFAFFLYEYLRNTYNYAIHYSILSKRKKNKNLNDINFKESYLKYILIKYYIRDKEINN